MEDLENGLSEQGLIDFVKTVLLSGNNPRGNEALKNLEWGIKQYRKHLILHNVIVPKGTFCDCLGEKQKGVNDKMEEVCIKCDLPIIA